MRNWKASWRLDKIAKRKIIKGNQPKIRPDSWPVGIGHITLADRGCELEQHFEFRAFRAEFEQSPDEREREHWLVFRLPFEPEGKCSRTFSQCKEKERDLSPFRRHVCAGWIKVADNTVSTEQAARVTGQMQGAEGCNDQRSAFMPKAGGVIHARW